MAIHKDDVIRLDIDDIPTKWYNIAADLPVPLPPPLHPGTMQPATAEDLSAIFPPSIVRQEMSTDRYIDIPEEVRGAGQGGLSSILRLQQRSTSKEKI